MKNPPIDPPISPRVPQSPREAMFLQYAQAYYQEMQAVSRNASFGQALNQAEAACEHCVCRD
jgi:hypothetical protein